MEVTNSRSVNPPRSRPKLTPSMGGVGRKGTRKQDARPQGPPHASPNAAGAHKEPPGDSCEVQNLELQGAQCFRFMDLCLRYGGNDNFKFQDQLGNNVDKVFEALLFAD